MRANIISKKKNARGIAQSNENSSLSLILKVAIVILILSFLPLLAGAEYSPTTKKCIACHNDTGYPLDSDGDGVAAPYIRPHNDNGSICEGCHGPDPHRVKFIQPNGTYGGKSTAASCPACHQTAIPNNNFTTAFRIPETLRHSSDLLNGSVWGQYWDNLNPKEACIYCHNNTLHNILPLGRILEWSPGYIINGQIGSNFSCSNCHYKASADYNAMITSFEAAGRPIPPEITNGTNWNGIAGVYFNHDLLDYTDLGCVPCHGNTLSPDATMSEFMHNVSVADMNNCLGCHRAGSSIPDVDTADLGAHINLNLTGGSGSLTSEDCRACHYNNPHTGTNPTNTYYCNDCHNQTAGGNSSIRATKKFENKRHGEATCNNCHIADGIYHQGNPRGSVNNSSYIARYISTNKNNTDCADCHLRANLDDAPFNAPSGGNHIISYGNGNCTGGCHTGGGTSVLAAHSIDPLDGEKPAITGPTLDHSSVTQGTDVTVTATASFGSADYAVVDGAQYRVMNSDNTQIIQPWTPMVASDGNFNSTSEVVRGIINTSSLSGTYNIKVRGMAGGPSQNPLERYYPMNGDISPVQSVLLTVQLQGGFITGTIRSGESALVGALVTTTGASDITGPDGTYSLSVPPGPSYTVIASKVPLYNVSTTPGIVVNAGGTTPNVNMTLGLLPTGTINGTVTKV